MVGFTRLATLWRIVREVDLEGIRQQAQASTRVLVVGETAADADDVSALLTGPNPDAAAWVTPVDATLAARDAETPSGGAVVDGPDLVILVAHGNELSPEMKTVRQWWTERRARMVRVVLQPGGRHGDLEADGQAARLVLAGTGGDALDHLARALFAVVEPDRRLSLARQFPPLRPCAFTALIDETAKANAGYSLSTGLAEVVPVLGIPLSIGDMIVLTKNQLMMSYRIALAAGKEGRGRDLIAEIIGVLGGGLLFRQIARGLAGMVPVLGIVPKVAVAYGGTWAIGRAVTVWATEGRRLSAERLRQLSREGLARGRQVAEKITESEN